MYTHIHENNTWDYIHSMCSMFGGDAWHDVCQRQIHIHIWRHHSNRYIWGEVIFYLVHSRRIERVREKEHQQGTPAPAPEIQTINVQDAVRRIGGKVKNDIYMYILYILLSFAEHSSNIAQSTCVYSHLIVRTVDHSYEYILYSQTMLLCMARFNIISWKIATNKLCVCAVSYIYTYEMRYINVCMCIFVIRRQKLENIFFCHLRSSLFGFSDENENRKPTHAHTHTLCL